jgi:FkbM family methyltransferase
MASCVFRNDNNVTLKLLNHPYSFILKIRDNHEVLFRRIHTYLILNKIIKNNIIDLGAWIGDNSLPWAKNTSDIIYAIDPSPNNCDFIQRTSQLNGINNLNVLQYAISDKNELLSTDDDINHCSFVNNDTGLNGKHKLHAISLDYLTKEGIIKNIGYIHLDVEGMEYRVLLGSTNLIDLYRPILTFEQHLELDNYEEPRSFLESKGYSVFLIHEKLPGCRPDCRNSIAFPKEICSNELIEKINQYIGKTILFPMIYSTSIGIWRSLQ